MSLAVTQRIATPTRRRWLGLLIEEFTLGKQCTNSPIHPSSPDGSHSIRHQRSMNGLAPERRSGPVRPDMALDASSTRWRPVGCPGPRSRDFGPLRHGESGRSHIRRRSEMSGCQQVTLAHCSTSLHRHPCFPHALTHMEIANIPKRICGTSASATHSIAILPRYLHRTWSLPTHTGSR
jgi:hypothetical protein